MSQFFRSGGQSIGVSASTSVVPMNIQDWFPLGWTGWISLQSKGRSRVFFNTTVQKHQFFGAHIIIVHLSHPYMSTGKTIALTRWTFVGKVMSLLFNMLSATAAKSLQLCPTLCDPIDSCPPGSAIFGILQAITLEWVAMLSRLVITFLPRSKCLLISWLQSPSAVILEPPKIKS